MKILRTLRKYSKAATRNKTHDHFTEIKIKSGVVVAETEPIFVQRAFFYIVNNLILYETFRK